MKLALVKSVKSFGADDDDRVAEELVRILGDCGHEAGLVRMPCPLGDAESILTSMVAACAYRIRDVDRIIVHGFPSYYIPHHDKRAWILREYVPEDEAMRSLVAAADRRALSQKTVYTASQSISNTLQHVSGIASVAMEPPPIGAIEAWRNVVERLTS
jgi:hypothetical protein